MGQAEQVTDKWLWQAGLKLKNFYHNRFRFLTLGTLVTLVHFRHSFALTAWGK
jgi:hypothetical protein